MFTPAAKFRLMLTLAAKFRLSNRCPTAVGHYKPRGDKSDLGIRSSSRAALHVCRSGRQVVFAVQSEEQPGVMNAIGPALLNLAVTGGALGPRSALQSLESGTPLKLPETLTRPRTL